MESLNCIKCGREYQYRSGAGYNKKLCRSCSTSRYRVNHKLMCVEYKGGKCVRCGYNKCLAAMHFHHVEPNKKDFRISGNHTASWERLKPELDKTVILCANCHAEQHKHECFPDERCCPYDTTELLFWAQYNNDIEDEKNSNNLKRDRINANKKKRSKFIGFRPCVLCGKDCSANNKLYCSEECSKYAQRKVERPNKELLEELVKTKSMISIAKDYNVSDNAVRKWCNAYGIEWRKR